MAKYLSGVGYMDQGSDYLGSALPTMAHYSSGGFQTQGDFAAAQMASQQALDRAYTNDINALNVSGVTGGPRIASRQARYLADRESMNQSLGQQWADSFGVNRKYNTMGVNDPIDTPEIRAMNSNINADRQRAAEAKTQVDAQTAYGKAYTDSGYHDTNAAGVRRAMAAQNPEEEDVFSPSGRRPTQRFLTPVGWSDTEPFPGYKNPASLSNRLYTGRRAVDPFLP